ncbi:MAG TPA: alpha/beta fold hydrolase [Candidatus Dormibacteraeota bacterium]|jgi:pimeloyl-ACP methyl ester carboxylesterase
MPQPVTGARKAGRAISGGASLHYEVAGSGPPVVLIHSGITDSRSWDQQMEAFARQYRVVRYDMRGFGQSDISHGAYSARADLEAVMDEVGMPRAALVAVSIGSALAVDFVLEHPERVTALVLVGPGIGGRVRSAEFAALMADVDRTVDEQGLDAGIERELEIWLYGRGRSASQLDPAVRAAVFDMDRFNSARIPDDMKALPAAPPAIGRLGEIRTPTLIIVGDLDVADVFDAADRLEAGIEGARRVTMTGTAHVPNMEQPERFNQIVLDFLGGAISATGRS